ncbi:Dor1-like family-domain-containing protein [Umbelopsis sp. PMI_123]|nr:Dor1-like family-domain-containing protein [Umbelopsis sp. PMI_123]
MALEALNARSNLEDNDELFSRLAVQLTGDQKQLIETSQWARDYVATLTSMSLEDLHGQPHKLTQEDSAVEKEIMALAFKEYPTFIRAEKCRTDIGDSFVKMEDQLNNLSNSLPDFEQLAREFTLEAKVLTEERQKTEKVLEDLDVLVDIFEIPQLMDTCVRNGYYSEAMDLTAHVSLLLMRYNNIPIIQTIHEKVQRSSDMMLIQLISLLRGPIKLPAAMNVIGYLRQMSSFETENELRILFLRCRSDYLNQRIEHVKKVSAIESEGKTDWQRLGRDSFEYVKQYIDVIREQVFEIITQYSSMFSEKLYGTQEDLTQTGTTELLTAGAALSDYVTFVLEDMRRTIEEHLVNIKDISQLSSLLTQLMYCGMSLGRVGLDFRSLFAMRFQDAMLKLTQRLIDDAKKGFLDAINKAKTENIPPSQWMATKASSKQPEQSPERQNRQQIASQLIEYPVIAVFTNAILTLFNELRLLAPIALVQPINNYLEAAHLEIAQQIQIYAAPYLLTESSTKENIKAEQSVIRSFASGYIRSGVPYLRQCLLDGIYADVYLEGVSVSRDRLETEMKDILPTLGELVNVKSVSDNVEEASIENKPQDEVPGDTV